MLTVRDSQLQAMADAAPGRQVIAPCPPTWIEVRLVDEDNQPVPHERYRIRLPDSSVKEGTLDAEGKVRVEGIVAGQCQVSFPDIDGKDHRSL
jgi:hypothetical protein